MQCNSINSEIDIRALWNLDWYFVAIIVLTYPENCFSIVQYEVFMNSSGQFPGEFSWTFGVNFSGPLFDTFSGNSCGHFLGEFYWTSNLCFCFDTLKFREALFCHSQMHALI